MVVNARQSCRVFFILFILIPGLSPLISEDSSPEIPVPIPEFSFDVLDFYSIGWSREGRIAFGVSSPGEGGGRSWIWYIQDLVEDKLLFSSPRWTLMEGQSPAELWARHPEWYSQLVRFGITPDDTVIRGEKIFRLNNIPYRMEVIMDRSETADEPEGLTRNISIQFYRNNNTVKTIYSYQPDPARGVVDDMVLKGYMKNPFENRIAVVALERSGPRSGETEWKYRVFGAHLSVGFSPIIRKGSELAEAVLNGQYYVSRMYLQNGADPNEEDLRGYSALLLAARRGLWDIASLLLEAGADPDRADDTGRTPLHYAVEAEDKDVVSILLDRGADPDRKDSKGLSARQEASIKGNPVIIKEFR